MNFLETLAIATIPAILTGIISYLRFSHELNRYKLETMAERAARHFLKNKRYTDRRFETLKKYLGGWDNDENELRKILVRAGAIRTYRDNDEWWTLLDRIEEKINHNKKK